MGRKDVEHPWLFARCREYQAEPYGCFDAWPRGHYKSTIISTAHTIFEILNNPEVTIALFSSTKPIAKGLMSSVKQELENNQMLKDLFPDILYQHPEKESPRWNEDTLQVKRKGSRKEATVEAWGVVEGQPISKHFDILKYDDVVTDDNSRTAEQINKTTAALKLSFSLGSRHAKMVFVGTRYSAGDSYEILMRDGTVKPRIYAATEDGKFDGKPVFLTREELDKKIAQMGSYIAGCQLFNNPVADNTMGFKAEWVQYYNKIDKTTLNIYIVVDPANEKKKNSDYTVMWVIGIDENENYYLLDGIKDRLNLPERADKLFRLREKWKPLRVGYEKYGMQADIGYLKEEQDRQGIRFQIVPLGGNIPKIDRVKRLMGPFERGSFYFPRAISYLTSENKKVNLIDELLYEYLNFPRVSHDDMMDALARIKDDDMKVRPPTKGGRRGSNYPTVADGTIYDF